VVRQYQADGAHLSFTIKGDHSVRVTSSEFNSGDLNLRIDKRQARKVHVRQGHVIFEVPAGEHSIEVSK
jgi:hypothetical protein